MSVMGRLGMNVQLKTNKLMYVLYIYKKKSQRWMSQMNFNSLTCICLQPNGNVHVYKQLIPEKLFERLNPDNP